MTTAELIALIREADPEGGREVVGFNRLGQEVEVSCVWINDYGQLGIYTVHEDPYADEPPERPGHAC